ncbi:MAG: recombinase family protein [Candidatus Electrothrix sp. ATG2]|nr:recombinase family protein [Candidatus Electrothrix sp. ATG2]
MIEYKEIRQSGQRTVCFRCTQADLPGWRLDRLGRSLKHLIEVVEDLEGQGTGFISLQEGFDTTTSGGRLVFQIFGALAEFERNLIRERTKAGLDAARARGRKLKLKPQQVAALKTMYESKAHTIEEVCAVFGITKPTLYRYLEG